MKGSCRLGGHAQKGGRAPTIEVVHDHAFRGGLRATAKPMEGHAPLSDMAGVRYVRPGVGS